MYQKRTLTIHTPHHAPRTPRPTSPLGITPPHTRHLTRSVCEWGRLGCLNESPSENRTAAPTTSVFVTSRHLASDPVSEVRGCHTLDAPLASHHSRSSPRERAPDNSRVKPQSPSVHRGTAHAPPLSPNEGTSSRSSHRATAGKYPSTAHRNSIGAHLSRHSTSSSYLVPRNLVSAWCGRNSSARRSPADSPRVQTNALSTAPPHSLSL